jgi:hypothetical protein
VDRFTILESADGFDHFMQARVMPLRCEEAGAAAKRRASSAERSSIFAALCQCVSMK